MPYSEKGESTPEVLRGEPEGEHAKRRLDAHVDESGHLILPDEVARRLGVVPGASIHILDKRGRFEILPSIHALARVYIEPTARCNLACQTCIRNTWNEPLGDMDPDVFDALVGQLRRFDHLESVMFGGFGEPTAHKGIVQMIGRVKSLGLKTEMVTNGTLLDEAMQARLIESGLDTLWVSFDGTIETSFQDIREGANFNRIVGSLKSLQDMNRRSSHRIEIGIAFVVMKRNVRDLENLQQLARSVGAARISVSNVLPYSEEMHREMLCNEALTLDTFVRWPGRIEIDIPRIDVTGATREALFGLLRGCENLTIAGSPVSGDTGRCRFIEDRCTVIRWDGKVSPCMGMLHSYKTFLNGCERTIRSYMLGDVGTSDLWDIWNSTEYAEFREKVRAFEYSPCHVCGGCPMLEKNEEDCFGNAFPACGGCLWAHGVVRCP